MFAEYVNALRDAPRSFSDTQLPPVVFSFAFFVSSFILSEPIAMNQPSLRTNNDRPFVESARPFPRLWPPVASPSPLLRREWPQPRITSQFPEIAQSARANGRRAAGPPPPLVAARGREQMGGG